MTALGAGRGGLFFCCSVATPAGKEDTVFTRQRCCGSTRHSDMWAEIHPVLLRATADVSGASSKRRSELDNVRSWRSRDEPQLWEGTTLQSHFQGNTRCEYDLLSLTTDYKKVTGEKKKSVCYSEDMLLFHKNSSPISVTTHWFYDHQCSVNLLRRTDQRP